MTFLCLLFAVTFHKIMGKVADNDKPQTPEEIMAIFTCTESFCGGRGMCRLDDLNRAICDCYEQYYIGEKCNIHADLCNLQQKAVRPNCFPGGTQMCASTYAMNNCICSEPFFGVYCEFSKAMYGVRAGIIKNPQGALVVVPMEPIAGKELELFWTVMNPGSATEFHLVIEGVIYEFDASQFQKMALTQVMQNFPHMMKNESIPQDRWVPWKKHVIVNPGFGKVRLIVFLPPIESQEIRLNYDFSYRAKVLTTECRARITHVGGACNPSLEMLFGLPKTAQLVFETYIRPHCDMKHSMAKEDYYLYFRQYINWTSLPPTQAKLKLLKKLRPRYVVTFVEIMKMLLRWDTMGPSSKILVIGSTREQNPAPKGATFDSIHVKDLPVVWAYCWIKYLHSDNHLPFVTIDGSYQWNTNIWCKQSYRVSAFTLNEPYIPVEWIVRIGEVNGQDRPKLFSKQLYWGVKDPDDKNFNKFQQFCIISYCENPEYTGYCPYSLWNTISCFWGRCCKSKMAEMCLPKEKVIYCSPTWASEFTNELALGIKKDHKTIPTFPAFDANAPFPNIINWTMNAKLVFTVFRVHDEPGYTIKKQPTGPEKHLTVQMIIGKEQKSVHKIIPLYNCGQGAYYNPYTKVGGSLNYQPVLRVDVMDFSVFELQCTCSCEYQSRQWEWMFCLGMEPNAGGEPSKCHNLEDILLNKGQGNQRSIAVVMPLTARSYKKNPVLIIMVRNDQMETLAKWAITYFELPYAPVNDFCQDVRITGIAMDDEFIGCIPNVVESQYFVFMLWQKVAEFPASRGFLFGFSYSAKIMGIWFPTTILAATYTQTVYELVSDATYNMEYAYPADVKPPLTKFKGSVMHVTFMSDLINGKLPFITPLEFDVVNNNIFHFVQKMHAMVIEVMHLSFNYAIDDNVYILNKRTEITEDMFKMIMRVNSVVLLETTMLTAVLYELVYANSLPLIHSDARRAGEALYHLSKSVETLIPSDVLFYKKTYRITDLYKTLLTIYRAVCAQLPEGAGDLLDDVQFLKITQNTVDELRAPDVISEFYEGYQFLDPDYYAKMKNYDQASIFGVNSAVTLAKSLLHYITVKFGSEYIPSINNEASCFLYAASSDLKKLISSGRVKKESAVTINFAQGKKILLPEVLLAVTIPDGLPLWSAQNSKYVFEDSAVQLVAKFGAFDSKNTGRNTDFTEKKNLYFGFTLTFVPPPRLRISELDIGIGGHNHVALYILYIPKEMPHSLLIVFDRADLPNLKVRISEKEVILHDFFKRGNYVTVTRKNTVVEYKIMDHMLNENYTRDNDTTLYLGIIPKTTTVEERFGFQVFATGCVGWNETEKGNQVWNWTCMESYGLAPAYEKKHYVEFKCVCFELIHKHTLYNVAVERIEPRLYGHIPLYIRSQPKICFIVPILTALVMLIYLGLCIIAHILDRNDTARRAPIFCISNRVAENYYYIIIVCTGTEPDSGTTSNIGIKLYGTLANSKRHVLRGISRDGVMKKRKIDWFCLTTEAPCGNVRAVELWSDNRGVSPHWRLEKLMVRDYNKMIEWVFMVNKWWSFIKDDGQVHRFLYQAVIKKPSILSRIFNPDDLYCHHIWMGMLVREHCHSFARLSKVNVAFAIQFLGASVAMFFGGIAAVSLDATVDEGDFHADWAFENGLLGLLCACAVIYPFMYVIKNGNPDRNYDWKWVDFSGMDPTAIRPLYLLEWKYMIAAWVIVAVIQFNSFCQLIFHGFHYGIRKSEMWAFSFLTIFLLDCIVVETIHVLIRNFITRVVMNLASTKRFCNTIINLYVENQKKWATVYNKKRVLKRDMFEPIPRRIRAVLRQKEENFRSMKVSISDFFFFLLLLANNTILFHYFHSFDANYSHKQMFRLMVADMYTQTLAFEDIQNIDQMMYFLNHTLMGATLWQSPAYMANSFVRLVGSVRLRQLKLRPGYDKCMPAFELKGNLVDRCEIEFQEKFMDHQNYNPFWATFNQSEGVVIDPHAHAFIYQNEKQARVFRKMVGYKMVPGGGYFTTLGRSPLNHRKVLRQLVLKKWFTNSTRYIFIDIVGYNPNSNLFNVVCLMMETSMTGDIIKNYSINTIRAFETDQIRVLIQYFLFAFLCFQVFNIIVRHLGKIKYCLVRVGAFQEVFVMTLAIQTLGTYAYRTVKIRMLMEDLFVAKKNTFINMEEVISVEWWSTLTTALWCSQNMLHLIDVFHFNPHIRIFYFTLMYALNYIHICVILSSLFLVSFSTAFHFIIGQENYKYRNIILSYMQVFGIPFSSKPTMDFQYGTLPNMIPYIMWTFYGYEYRFLIFSMFAIVLVNSYHRGRLRLFHASFKYSLNLYIKERILRNKIVFDDDRALPKMVEYLKKREAEKILKAEEEAKAEAEAAQKAYEEALKRSKGGRFGRGKKTGPIPPPPPKPPS